MDRAMLTLPMAARRTMEGYLSSEEALQPFMPLVGTLEQVSERFYAR